LRDHCIASFKKGATSLRRQIIIITARILGQAASQIRRRWGESKGTATTIV
jgi:hypothetical protein